LGEYKHLIITLFLFILAISLCFAEEIASEKSQQNEPSTLDESIQVDAGLQQGIDAAIESIPKEESSSSSIVTEEPPIDDPDGEESGGGDSPSGSSTGDTYRPYIHSPVSPGEKFSTNGFFETSLFTGAATYTYPISVPPGTNGLTPSVFLSYNSQAANSRPSIVGSGWTLSDNYIQRKANYSFSNDTDDEFILVLNGASYELVYVPTELRFHTKVESYMFIKNTTNGNNSLGSYWIVKTPDGTNYRFGFKNSSEMVSTMHPYVWRWSLDLINDTHGNMIGYDYYENIGVNDSSAVYPKTITYNNDAKRKIEFVYEAVSRPDIWLAFQEGTKLRETRRLADISITANSALVSRYHINYLSLTDSLSSIQNITRFGSDNTTALPSTKFEYFNETKGWVESSTWRLPQENSSDDVTFTNNLNHWDRGRQLADVNRDGLVDIIAAENLSSGNSFRKTWINNGTGWENSSTWTVKDPLTSNQLILFMRTESNVLELGKRLVDMNADGLTDIVMGFNGDRITWINNGNGWERDSNYTLPDPLSPTDYSFTSEFGSDRGTRAVDINGDGYIDLLSALHPLVGSTDRYSSVRNDGFWSTNTGWFLPNVGSAYDDIIFSYAATSTIFIDDGRELVDINGDSLVDIYAGWNHIDVAPNDCISYDINSYINNGTSWTNDTGWHNVFDPTTCDITFVDNNGELYRDRGRRFGDINGDGLIDIVAGFETNENSSVRKAWINTGRGWKEDSSWIIPANATFSKNITQTSTVLVTYDTGTRLVDVDGDGLVDLVKGEQNASLRLNQKIWINQAKKAHLLKRITNEMGGITDINYAPSTSFITVNESGHGNMGFSVWVVSNVTSNNGMSGAHNYSVRTKYAYDDPVFDYGDKENRGFNYVKVIDPDSSYSEHYFHQDDAKKGREYQTDLRTSSGTLVKRVDSTWDNDTNSQYFIVTLLRTNSQDYESSSSSFNVTITYDYDVFGNVISINNTGKVGFGGDSRFENYQYLNNSAKWIVNRPKKYTMKASDNTTIIRESYFRYDNLGYGTIPTKGDLTWKEDYLENGTNPVVRFDYESQGNVITQYDPKNSTMNYSYGSTDTTHTFPDDATNAKGHVVSFTYNLSTGNLLTQDDANGNTISYVYDVFGRKVREILPYDDSGHATKNIAYTFDGSAPEQIETQQRVTAGVDYSHLSTFVFYDGLGNVIQTKKEEDNDRQVELDVYYDSFGRILNQSNPYFIQDTTSYSTPNTSVKGIDYFYDSMDRVVRIVNPDNTDKEINFSRWNVTAYDENGNKKQYLLDAYDRIAYVYEFNSGSTYMTNYTYDTADQLTKITDDQDNEIEFTYDTLGRKIRLIDPDLGTWDYTYDTVGNLVSQTDGNGRIITLGYDSLNRVTSKSASGGNVSYTYDTNDKGTLFKVTNTYGEKNFTYDDRYRVISQKERRYTLSFVTNYSYDSMDRVTQKTMPNGVVIAYNYSNNTQLFAMSNVLTNVSYNELGLPTRRKYTSGIDSNFTYNSSNLRLSNIKTSTLQNLNYHYDGVGNVLKIVDSANSRDYVMTYDDLDRLLTADLTNSTTTLWTFDYTYDSIGNIITVDGSNGNMDYNYSSPVHAPSQITTT